MLSCSRFIVALLALSVANVGGIESCAKDEPRAVEKKRILLQKNSLLGQAGSKLSKAKLSEAKAQPRQSKAKSLCLCVCVL